MKDTITLRGKSRVLTFEVYDLDCEWHAKPGIYGYLRRWHPDHWLPYVGRTNNFQVRHQDHHVHDKALKLGCNEFFALVIEDEDERAAWEQEIYDEYRPMLNKVRPSGPVIGAGTRAIFGLAPLSNPALFNMGRDYQKALAAALLEPPAPRGLLNLSKPMGPLGLLRMDEPPKKPTIGLLPRTR
jgi:hypothetical protein